MRSPRWSWPSCCFLLLGLIVLALAIFDGDMPSGVMAATGSGWWDMVQSRIDNVWLFREEMFFVAPMSVALFLLVRGCWRQGYSKRGACACAVG